MNLDDLLGIDPADPHARRARRLREADRKMLNDLIEQRKRLKLSQEEVARRMDTGQSTITRIESGARDLHQSTIRRYAMAVEATIEHTVIPDDPAKVRSSRIIRDLGPQLVDKLQPWGSFQEVDPGTVRRVGKRRTGV